MKIKLLLALFLVGVSGTTEALVGSAEKEIASGEIIAKKNSYDTLNMSAADIQRLVDEKRKERNVKVQAVMKIARDADVPAGLFLESIRDGVVVPELLAENSKKLDAWKSRRRAPRELQIPWGNIFLCVVLLVILMMIVIIKRGKRNARVNSQPFKA